MFHNWIKAIQDVIFPRYCAICSSPLAEKEKYICFSCYHLLPFTDDYENPTNNVLYNRFATIYDVEIAVSLLLYQKKGPSQKILQQIKYKNNKHLGTYLGEILANNVKNIIPNKREYQIIPVPLHPKKEYFRGYNQAEAIAKGISKVLNIPVYKKIKRKTFTKTQTKKGKEERQEIIEKNIFEIPEQIPKAILVDDVITTGSTMEALLKALKEKGTEKFIIFCLARAIK